MILAVFFMDKINGFMTLLNSGMFNRSQGDLLHGSERNIVESADGIIEWNFISQFCDCIPVCGFGQLPDHVQEL